MMARVCGQKRLAISSFTPVPGALLQRKCACGGTLGPTGECSACRKNRESKMAQRKTDHSASANARASSEVPAIVHRVLEAPGQPLNGPTRSFMESRFRHDFSKVRVHADAEAAESARSLDARAYTAGRDIVFAAGEYAPGTNNGRRLLAHELTHAVQQSAAKQSTRDGISLGSVHSPQEEEAEALSRDMAATPALTAAQQIQRKKWDTLPVYEERPEIIAQAKNKVCMTYDDGPQKGTEDVLDVHAGSIPATFFLTGKNMQSDPANQKKLVERMLNEGHKIGNHTFTHDPMTAKGYEKAYGDLSDPAKLKKFQDNYNTNEQHFQKLLGSSGPVFKLARLPGQGRFIKVGGKLILVAATEGMGMAHATWNFEFGTNGSFGHLKATDWQGIKGVASEADKLPKANDIILLHDRHWAGKKSLLKAILDKLAGAGFKFGQLNDTGKCG